MLHHRLVREILRTQPYYSYHFAAYTVLSSRPFRPNRSFSTLSVGETSSVVSTSPENFPPNVRRSATVSELHAPQYTLSATQISLPTSEYPPSSWALTARRAQTNFFFGLYLAGCTNYILTHPSRSPTHHINISYRSPS